MKVLRDPAQLNLASSRMPSFSPVLGAIIGDIVGSRFEHRNTQCHDFDFFTPACRFTDDTVLTLAVCDALVDGAAAPDRLAECARKKFLEFFNRYPRVGYGSRFSQWALLEGRMPYKSCGNGSAMRISGCGAAAKSLDEVRRLAHAVTAVTHGHPDGLKGAEAVAVGIYLARTGADKAEVQSRLSAYYDLSFTLDEIRPSYPRRRLLNTCRHSVPQAIRCFLEADSFEEAVRLAVSLGGDSDTLAAMAGSLAAPRFGIPDAAAEAVNGYLDDFLRRRLQRFEATFSPRGSGESASPN